PLNSGHPPPKRKLQETRLDLQDHHNASLRKNPHALALFWDLKLFQGWIRSRSSGILGALRNYRHAIRARILL
ncbi:unnamed protein product, partial [Brassica oleracea var. botrytis]